MNNIDVDKIIIRKNLDTRIEDLKNIINSIDLNEIESTMNKLNKICYYSNSLFKDFRTEIERYDNIKNTCKFKIGDFVKLKNNNDLSIEDNKFKVIALNNGETLSLEDKNKLILPGGIFLEDVCNLDTI